MSYILDALKKSEAERQQGKAPGFATVQPRHSQGARRRRLWPILLAAVLALNAGIILVALRPWEHPAPPHPKPVQEFRAPEAQVEPKPSPTEQAVGADLSRSGASAGAPEPAPPQPAAREAEPPAPASPPPAVASRQTTDGPQPDPAPAASGAARRAAAKASPPEEEVRFASSKPSLEPRAAESANKGSAAPAPGVASPTKPAPRVPEARERPAAPDPGPPVERSRRPAAAPPAVQEHSPKIDVKRPGEQARHERPTPSRSEGPKELHNMPSTIRDEVPKLSFSFLVYSDRPEERMVTINGKRMREGEEVMSGLRLEEITREGAILSWKGQRFHKSVF